MEKEKKQAKHIRLLKNKYVLSVFFFAVWLFFFDGNNIVKRFRELRQLNQFQQEKQYLIDRIKYNAERIKELKTDDINLEKFAREQYMMKKDDEDVFVIIEEEEE